MFNLFIEAEVTPPESVFQINAFPVVNALNARVLLKASLRGTEKPQRLWEWAAMASEVVREHAQ